MHKNVTRLVFPLLAGALLAGCVTTEGVDPEAPIVPLVDVAQRKADLAVVPANERVRWCRISRAQPSLARRATTTGPIEYQDSNAQRAGNALFGLVETYYAGEDVSRNYGVQNVAKKIRDTLEEGARTGAFTVLVPYTPREFPGYNPMNEPVFQVANFMVPLAHAYLILKEEFPEDTVLLSDVKRWGDRLFEVTSGTSHDFKGKHRSIDRRVTIAAGWASWGNAANNRVALAHAYRYYIHALAGTGRGGADQLWRYHRPKGMEAHLYYVNVTISAALVTAHALHRSGADDAYTVAPGGGTIVEGAAWLWNRLLEEQDWDLLRTRYSGSRGVAWAELFVHEFPNHPAAASMDAWLATKSALYLNMGGGPTTCLYRRIPMEA